MSSARQIAGNSSTPIPWSPASIFVIVCRAHPQALAELRLRQPETAPLGRDGPGDHSSEVRHPAPCPGALSLASSHIDRGERASVTQATPSHHGSPATLAAAHTVVQQWRSETLATIDATVHTATPLDMEWLNGRMATLNNVLALLSADESPTALRKHA